MLSLFKPTLKAVALATLILTGAAAQAQNYGKPQVVVAPSNFKGVHGLAVDKQGRLLAGSVVGMSITQVDLKTGKGSILVDAPQGQADDIAIGPKGEMAWTSFLQGVVRIRDNDSAPIRVIAKDLPGINSISFDQKSGKLYASQVFLGDALWELDVTGAVAPRLITKTARATSGRLTPKRVVCSRSTPLTASAAWWPNSAAALTTWPWTPKTRFMCPTWPTTVCSASTQPAAKPRKSPRAAWQPLAA